VLLALHGYAMTAEEMHGFLPRLAPPGFLAISIEGPQSTLVPGKESGIDSPRGFHWGVSPRAEENRAVHRAAVEAAIGWAAANGGDPARVSLLGFSQPTSFNYRLALAPPHGHPFRVLIGLCGGVPGEWSEAEPPATRESRAASALHISTREDPFYKPAKTETFERLLAARFGDVTHRVLEGGHRIPSAALPIIQEQLAVRGL